MARIEHIDSKANNMPYIPGVSRVPDRDVSVCAITSAENTGDGRLRNRSKQLHEYADGPAISYMNSRTLLL
jgi:hypothetical protein